jgi:uncharacterized protein (TIGR02145 family)
MTELIGFTLTNEATKSAVLYTGVGTTLDITLTNNTGGPIGMTADADGPSTLTFYWPADLFTSQQLDQLGVAVAGWQPSVDTDAGTLTLTCTADATLAAQASLTFPVTTALTTASPTPGFTVALAPENLTGNVPSQVNAQLAVTLPPKPGNLSLPDVLQVSLDNQGLVYCSESSNTLVNRLFLTLKNTGETALATDQTLAGNPQVLVSFVYGNTGGALAPAGVDSDSAWAIRTRIDTQPPRAAWTPSGKPLSGTDEPKWLFNPSEGNVVVLAGVRTDAANVTFVFDQVVANPNPGHTQMFVLCTGFAKNATTKYDDHLYVLDVNKQAPPPTLGVLAFAAQPPVITVSDPHAPVEIPLIWTTFGAASVNLLTSSGAVGLVNVPSPPGSGLLVYGHKTLTIDPPGTSQALFLTLQALDTAGGYLGGAQFTAFLDVAYLQDPDGWVYPVARFGNSVWTLADYAYQTAHGSYVYGDQTDPPRGTTRLYTAAAAAAAAPPGWSLPTVADWQALVNSYPDGPYAALITGGVSGFGADLTGLRLDDGTYANLGAAGYYWADSNTAPLTQFSGTSHRVSVGAQISGQVGLAVRYVRPA